MKPNEEVLIRVASIKCVLDLSNNLGTRVGWFRSWNSNSQHRQRTAGLQNLAGLVRTVFFTGLSSSSKVSISFLTRSRVGAFSQSHWEQVVGCSHLQFCWRIYRISDPSHLPLLFPLLPHQGLCFKPAEKTASLTQCQRAAPWVATLASTLPQHVAAVHMTLFLVIWVLFFRLSLIYELVFRHICLWYVMGTDNANSHFFQLIILS